jgi:hypothetical protein
MDPKASAKNSKITLWRRLEAWVSSLQLRALRDAHVMDRSRFAVRQHCSRCAGRPSEWANLPAWRTTLRSDANQLRSFHARPSSPFGPCRRARCSLGGCHQALTSRNARRDASCLCRLPGHRTAGAHASGRRGGDGKGAVLKTPATRYCLEGLLKPLESKFRAASLFFQPPR